VRRGFYVTVTTNGTLITEKRARALAAIPSDRLHLNISLDGDRVANDEVRGEGMWDRAIAGYRRVRAADAAAGNARRKVLANTILHARNLDRFESILDEQAALGFDGVQILTLFRTSPEESPPQAEALWFQSEHQPHLRRLTEALAQRAERQGPAGYRIQNLPEELRRVPRYYTEAVGPLEAPCWAGWKELYINADGRAIMCDGKLDFLAGAWGDVRRQTLRQIWSDPDLRKRREVVKQCTTPCIQKCYLRPESDRARDILVDGARLAGREVRRQLRALRPHVEREPAVTLRIELSDVCPCDWEGCATPVSRWQSLTGGIPERPDAVSWGRMRDHGYLNFGRGFMGFDVVRSLVADLRDGGTCFGVLALRWRGEPLLHPEAAPIIRYLLSEAIGSEGVAERLRIETDGRFLSEELLEIAAAGGPQDWFFDLDRGDGAGVEALWRRRGDGVRLVLVCTAGSGSPAAAWAERYPQLSVVVGAEPTEGDAIWVRQAVHDHYLATRAARRSLEAVASELELPIPPRLDGASSPVRCTAPAREPVISWDGKVALCPADVLLSEPLGEVTPGSFHALWTGEAKRAAVVACETRGRPDRNRCRSCGRPHAHHG